MSRRLIRLSPLVCALLVACAASAPSQLLPATAPRALPAALAALPGADAEAQPLWRLFDGDEAAKRALVQRVLDANPTLHAARARWEQSQQLAAAARAASLPQGSVSASAGRERTPADGGGHRSANAYSLGAALTWELDLFGAVASRRDVARLGVEAARAELDGARLALAAAALSAQQELQAQRLRLRLALDTREVQREVMRLIDLRVSAGRSNALDQARAQALLASTEALVPALQQGECLLALRLQTLQGQPADAKACETAAPPAPAAGPADAMARVARASAATAQLVQPRRIALGQLPSPEQLLGRRFDVRIAEVSERLAYEQVRQAWAARWPRLSLSGELGWSAARLGDLLKGDALASGVAARLSGSWLDFGARAAEQGAAEASFRAAVAQADAARLAAVEDAQASLVSLARIEEQVVYQRRAAEAASRAREIALRRFEAGLSDFLPLLDAERERLSAEDRRLQLELARNLGLIDVAKALGGPLD